MKLSVIIPAYNASEFISESVNSILTINSNQIEIIVVDDGSKDNTFEVLSNISDTRIRVLRKNNGGVSSARNCGLKYAQGEYITFLDADDLVDSHVLEKIINCMDDKNDVIYYSKDYTQEDIRIEVLINGVFGAGDRIPKNGSAPYSKLYRRSFLKENNIAFNSNVIYGEDGLFILECICKGAKIGYEKVSWYFQRNVNENSVTRSWDERWFDSNIIFLKESQRLLLNSKLNLDEQLYNYWISMALYNSISRYMFFLLQIEDLTRQNEKLLLFRSPEFKKLVSFYKSNLQIILDEKKYKGIVAKLVMEGRIRRAFIIYRVIYIMKKVFKRQSIQKINTKVLI